MIMPLLETQWMLLVSVFHNIYGDTIHALLCIQSDTFLLGGLIIFPECQCLIAVG